ncbi:MAG TPA: hypothetical protein VJ794_00810 [Gemmatimonadales bacterium]|nr:hypothetical protein [Gemmatimonadales bacterium]
MRARTTLLLIILLIVGIFGALNWAVFTARTPLSFGFWTVEAPLGLILLAVIAALTLLYLVFLAWLETTALLEARRYGRELLAQRQLAESAEASRFAELKRSLETELGALQGLPEAAARDVLARVEQAEAALRADIERAGNTLAAYIGELEDRLRRPGAEPP